MKLRVTDKSGRLFRADMIEPKKNRVSDAEVSDKTLHDKDEELSAADIAKIKKLLPYLDDLLAMLDAGKDDGDFDKEDLEFDEDLEEVKDEAEEEEKEEVEVVEDDEVKDACDDSCEESEEESEETEEEAVVHDSKAVAKSVGAIRRNKVNDSAASDSELDLDAEIAEAWNKRYGG